MDSGRFIATVSQVNRRIALNFKKDDAFKELYVKGEISNFICHYKSGHFYFTLKDSESSLKCVMFAHEAERLKFMPENGQSVMAKGTVGVFERDGVYQLYVCSLEEERENLGTGLYDGFLKLKEQLEKEGVFTNNRALPPYPEKICLITSRDGAALQDMISVFKRRYPVLEVVVIPVIVQGKNAPMSVISALRIANLQETGHPSSDIIIIARGGGSAEDLWAFNDEALAREIRASNIPVVSAIGHETDFSICDFAADLRAPTPSAAAELTTPDLSDLKSVLNKLMEHLKRRVFGIIERKVNKAEYYERDINARMKNIFLNKNKQLEAVCSLIEALNPEKILARGYAAVFNQNGKVLRAADDTRVGDELNIKLANGELTVTVKEKTSCVD